MRHLERTLAGMVLWTMAMTTPAAAAGPEADVGPAPRASMVNVVYKVQNPQAALQLFKVIGSLDILRNRDGERIALGPANNLFLRVTDENRKNELLDLLKSADVPEPASTRETMQAKDVVVRIRTIMARTQNAMAAPQGSSPLDAGLAKILSSVFGFDHYVDLGTHIVVSQTNERASIEFSTESDLELDLHYKMRPRDDGRLDMEVSIASLFKIRDVADGRDVAKGKLQTLIIAEPGKEFVLGNTQVATGASLIFTITADLQAERLQRPAR